LAKDRRETRSEFCKATEISRVLCIKQRKCGGRRQTPHQEKKVALGVRHGLKARVSQQHSERHKEEMRHLNLLTGEKRVANLIRERMERGIIDTESPLLGRTSLGAVSSKTRVCPESRGCNREAMGTG